MFTYYHTTKLNNLNSILQNGLQPIYGKNSALTADNRTGKISYSAGLQATVTTFSVFRRFYNNIVEGRINEDVFKSTLSPEEYAIHQDSIRKIQESTSFEDWIKDNVYLCFDGNCISDKHEEKPEDAYTSDSIPPEQLRVCTIKRKANNSVYSFSMKDAYCFLYAKNPELKKEMGTWRFEEDIDKYRDDDYYMDYMSLEHFCELYPELTGSPKNRIYIKLQTVVKNALRSGITRLERDEVNKIYTNEKGEKYP